MIAEESPKREAENNGLRHNHFAQRAGGHVVGVAAHLNLLGKKSDLPDPQDLLGDVLVDVAKSVETQVRGVAPGLGREPPAEFLIGDGHQAALRMLNYGNGASPQELCGKNQRTNYVVGGNASCVANHVSVAYAQPQQLLEIHAR